MGKRVNVAVAGCLLVMLGLTGCAGGGGSPAGITADDKKTLSDPLFGAELMSGGICSTSVRASDQDANRCAAVLTQTTVKIADVHAMAQQHGIRDPLLDSSADEVARFAKVCNPKGPDASLTACLAGAGRIKEHSTVYVQTLRGKLNAAK